MTPKTMATIAQPSAKMRPVDMAFSQTSGGEFERRAFVRCAGGKTRYFASPGVVESSRVQLVRPPA
jgi:hypothetical protein